MTKNATITYDAFPTDEEWTPEEAERAEAEGWALMECDGSTNGYTQLQKLDEAGVFEADIDAWRFVDVKAVEGSTLHAKALHLIEKYNPPERRAIEKALVACAQA